jgi:hypothetical protein
LKSEMPSTPRMNAGETMRWTTTMYGQWSGLPGNALPAFDVR